MERFGASSVLVADAMLLTDDPASGDRLNRSDVVATLETLLDQIAAPACVAVYGSWGAGKTSILSMMRQRWIDTGGKAVWFDPWEHERRPDLLGPLVLAIAATRPKSLGRPIAMLAKGILRSLGKLAGSVEWEIGIPGAKAKVSLEDTVAEFKEGVREFSYKNEVQEIKQDFAELVKTLVGDEADAKPLIVFLDDLDRCLPETAVDVIEGVKLLLCARSSGLEVARVVFVFALDRQIVGEAIRHRYGGASTYTGENYLEKIFDFSVELPQVAGTAANAFLDHLGQGIEPFRVALGNVVQAVPAFANPRVIKRAVNRLRLFAQLHEEKKSLDRHHAYRDMVGDGLAVARFVCWVCGAERFRSFRRYFFEAPPDELDLFNAYLVANPANPRGQLSPDAAAIADSPGFRSYYLHLSNLSAKNLIAQREARQYSVKQLDDWLRSLGL